MAVSDTEKTDGFRVVQDGRLSRRSFLKKFAAGSVAVATVYAVPRVLTVSPRHAYAQATGAGGNGEPPEPPADALIMDTFSADDGTELDGRPPEFATAAVTWAVEAGNWQITGGSATEISDVDPVVSPDFRALIPVPDVAHVITATVVYGNGGQLIGIVGRAGGPSDWVMLFFDGVSDLVLGAKDSAVNSGAFQELGRSGITWTDGQTRVLSLQFAGDQVTASVDGAPVMTRTYASSGGSAGLFSRGGGGTRFDDFLVTSLAP